MCEKEYFGHPEFYKIIDELKELHSKKNKQYANQANPMNNFHKCGALCDKLFNPELDNKALAQLLSLMSKQIVAVYDMVGENKKDTIEEVEDKLKDIAVYSILAIILKREGDKK